MDLLLGDSAFPLSDTMITPFRRNQVNAEYNKALFNVRYKFFLVKKHLVKYVNTVIKKIVIIVIFFNF